MGRKSNPMNQNELPIDYPSDELFGITFVFYDWRKSYVCFCMAWIEDQIL
jgi:hypothetical protein